MVAKKGKKAGDWAHGNLGFTPEVGWEGPRTLVLKVKLDEDPPKEMPRDAVAGLLLMLVGRVLPEISQELIAMSGWTVEDRTMGAKPTEGEEKPH